MSNNVYIVTRTIPQSNYTEPDYWAPADDAKEILGVFDADKKAYGFRKQVAKEENNTRATSYDEMLTQKGKTVLTADIDVDEEYTEIIREALLQIPENESDCFGEDETISFSADFPDGYCVDVKLCGVQFEEGGGENNLPWTEAVLFKNGAEVCCTEPDTSFFGEWRLEADGKIFVVNVYPEDGDTPRYDVEKYEVQ